MNLPLPNCLENHVKHYYSVDYVDFADYTCLVVAVAVDFAVVADFVAEME